MLIHLPDVPEPEMRLSVNKRQSLWPNGLIPYVINDDIEPANRDIIISAMDQFEDKTCIRFIPRTTETTYTRFVTKRGCTSLLGYSWSPQEISLRSPMCMHVGIVMHELMHTLGFLHEQCRPDRDDYVTILWNNIEQDYWRQFKKRTTDESITLGLPYDYCSIMHYDDHAFTSNGKKTLVPLKKPSCELGQKIRLSPLDIKKVNILYNCPGYRTNVGPIITSTSKPTTTLYENEGRLNKDHK
ncbi:hypothetical protein TCAL_13681 [Tigriopus californicus]|uniref:Metalloendopeptidase n=2 Tax=Tigriopus californicus TaxID=6832 RepID=A0A553P0A1_TIGCA|nr:hypothetical protein TCAL_13681 [Tigriopus californicus]|eukprot:TCALIF_13681-PA protein Name:"Similar to nas-4 Zinc metalloproteinase nas-4 (Caenorhabditis elegans)" AED:0.15 eAED:0.15 QI:0/0.33/0/1/1/1/4/0/241